MTSRKISKVNVGYRFADMFLSAAKCRFFLCRYEYTLFLNRYVFEWS